MTEANTMHDRAVWFDIPVADLERAARFYRSVLGIEVHPQTFGDVAFCVLGHGEGNGGCLVLQPEDIAPSGGVLVYLNVDRRIRDAVAQVEPGGGDVVEAIRSIGPHGFRAVVHDSEGNRIALHSTVDA